MKKKDRVIIWPQYFDKKLSRHKGRKVSLKYAVDSPTIDDLVKAASKLRLDFEVDKDARFPRLWWKPSGRILVKKKIAKYYLIKRLGTAIKDAK